MTSGTTVFPCQNCGSTMAWDPAARVMACGHCGNRQAVTPVGTAVREHAFAELARLPAKPVASLGPAFICPNCGARTESDLLSANCQFCGTPLAADPAAIERVAPEAVVPFGISKQQAGDALKKWTSSRWFAPGGLKKVSSAETFTGSYLVADWAGGPSLAAGLGKAAPRGTVVIGSGNTQKTQISIYDFFGHEGARLVSYLSYAYPEPPGPDLTTLAGLVAASRLDPAIGLTLPWTRLGDALTALAERRISGKAVITIG